MALPPVPTTWQTLAVPDRNCLAKSATNLFLEFIQGFSLISNYSCIKSSEGFIPFILMKPKNLVLEFPETQPVCTDISGKTCGVMGSPVQRISFYKYQELKQCFTLQSWVLVFIMFVTQRSPHGSMNWLFSVFFSFALWQLHLYYLFLFNIFTYWLCWDIVAAILCKGRGILSDLFIWIFGYTGSHCCAAFSLVAASRGYSSCRAQASYCGGFSHWGAQALWTWASVAVACA